MMVVFRIHCKFFIVVPISLKISRSNVFFSFTKQNVRAQCLTIFARPSSSINNVCRICPGNLYLYSKLQTLHNELLLTRGICVSTKNINTVLTESYGKTWVTSYYLQVEGVKKVRREIQKCEFKSKSRELKFPSYKFKSRVVSSNPQVQKLLNQVKLRKKPEEIVRYGFYLVVLSQLIWREWVKAVSFLTLYFAMS